MKYRLGFYIATTLTLLVAIPLISHAEERAPKTTQEAIKQFRATDAELNNFINSALLPQA